MNADERRQLSPLTLNKALKDVMPKAATHQKKATDVDDKATKANTAAQVQYSNLADELAIEQSLLKQRELADEEKEQALTRVTLELMNACAVKSHDLHALLSCDTMCSLFQGLYVRMHMGGSCFRLLRIEKILDSNAIRTYNWTAFGVKTSQMLNVCYGTKVSSHVSWNKVSDDDVTALELGAWIVKMRNDGVPLPELSELEDAKVTLQSIREYCDFQALARQQPEAAGCAAPPDPGSDQKQRHAQLAPEQHVGDIGHKHGSHSFASSSLNARNLEQLNRMHPTQHQKQDMLRCYLLAVRLGHSTFWWIPEADDDSSQFVAFVLVKRSTSKPFLERALQCAKAVILRERGSLPTHVSLKIRERPVCSEHQSYGFWKCNGLLIDCVTTDCAHKVKGELDALLTDEKLSVGSREKESCNFCRLVFAEFGRALMAVQSLPKAQRPLIAKDLKGKPQGPKRMYFRGEPSMASGAASMHASQREIYGECDHTIAPTELEEERKGDEAMPDVPLCMDGTKLQSSYELPHAPHDDDGTRRQ